MDMSRIEALVDLVSRTNVSEITIRAADNRITVRKAYPAREPAGQMVVHPDSAIMIHEQEPAPDLAVTEAPTAESTTIIASMVGIFHHAEPPVSLGSVVAPGQIVGAIESMKLMNDVRAEAGGRVESVEVEAGMAVEYGQPLFTLVPTDEGEAS